MNPLSSQMYTTNIPYYNGTSVAINEPMLTLSPKVHSLYWVPSKCSAFCGFWGMHNGMYLPLYKHTESQCFQCPKNFPFWLFSLLLSNLWQTLIFHCLHDYYLSELHIVGVIQYPSVETKRVFINANRSRMIVDCDLNQPVFSLIMGR